MLLARSLILLGAYRRAPEYFFAALLRAWPSLAAFLLIESVIASVPALVLTAVVSAAAERMLISAATGLLLALVTAGLGELAMEMATTGRMERRLFRTLVKLATTPSRSVAWAIQRLRQQDNFDCQQCVGWWNVGLTPTEVSRRIRILYEAFKVQIAASRRQPWLLRADVGVYAGQKFYPLIQHLGRAGLRELLRTPPPAGFRLGWA